MEEEADDDMSATVIQSSGRHDPLSFLSSQQQYLSANQKSNHNIPTCKDNDDVGGGSNDRSNNDGDRNRLVQMAVNKSIRWEAVEGPACRDELILIQSGQINPDLQGEPSKEKYSRKLRTIVSAIASYAQYHHSE